MSDSPLKVWIDRNGKLLRLRLARPKANIVDAEMLAAIDKALVEYADNSALHAVLIDHEGGHFSFGASVQEHLPGLCDDMLKAMHGVVKRMINHPLPILVAANGQCLGGGMEVACAGSQIFAGPNTQMGQPEIKVGVFAPAASCLLPELVGQAYAEDLLYSGRSVSAEEALAMGLVASVTDDPEATALKYFDDYLAPVSASVLRYAVQGAREDFAARVSARLDKVEQLYLQGLMATEDAVEGLNAFLEKRPAIWKNQ